MPRQNQWVICSHPNCPEQIQGRTRCPEHAREADAYRPNATQRGYDARWRKASRAYLLANPHCAVDGCYAAATDTDHIDGLGPLGPRGYDKANWMPLCHPHHSAKTAAETARRK